MRQKKREGHKLIEELRKEERRKKQDKEQNKLIWRDDGHEDPESSGDDLDDNIQIKASKKNEIHVTGHIAIMVDARGLSM